MPKIRVGVTYTVHGTIDIETSAYEELQAFSDGSPAQLEQAEEIAYLRLEKHGAGAFYWEDCDFSTFKPILLKENET